MNDKYLPKTKNWLRKLLKFLAAVVLFVASLSLLEQTIDYFDADSSEAEIVREIKGGINKGDNRLSVTLNALSDPGRLRVFRLLVEYHDVCVTDIAKVLDVSVPAVSQQLRFLEISGLVKKCRKGKTVCYEIKNEDPLVKSLVKILITKK